MAEFIEFTNNYNDLSTDRGFQFEFLCNNCSSGYRTQFQPFMAGTVAGALDTANSLFGGLFGHAAELGERVRSAGWQKAKDEAYAAALQEIRAEFVQCPRCQNWVCQKRCWNGKRGLCKQCSPDLGVEMSAAQAARSVEEVWAHARMSDEDRKLSEGNWSETIRASCPECGAAQATNAKFCPDCGAKLKTAAHCPECGSKLQPDARFCTDCGNKVQ
jgi:hypothetical protein